MDIGWAVDKGLDALKISYQIYKAFRDPDSNAPQQFRDLAREFSDFHTIFVDYLDVLEKYKKPLLLPPSSIQYTLDKCRLFQEKFGILSDVTTKKSIKHGITFSFRTLQWSFLADELVKQLRAELASHAHILSLHTATITLRGSLEDRVENHEIREQNRELIHMFKTHKQTVANQQELELPRVPQHIPLPIPRTTLELPDVPRHPPSAAASSSSNRLAELDTAIRDLEALDHLLRDEERVISDLHLPSGDGDSPRSRTNFISLARQDLELQKKRISNYRKRMQLLPGQPHTTGGEMSELDTRQPSPTLSDAVIDNTWDESDSVEPHMIQPISPRSHRIRSFATSDFPSIGISIADVADTSYSRLSLQSRRESVRRRGTALPDDVSIAFRRYLERFEVELDELDQYDVDNQIAKTKDELYDLLQRSFPPSPDLRLAPSSPGGSNHASPRMDGMLSSSPPVFGSYSRRPTLETINTRRGSVDGGSWRYLAKDAHINDIPYSCSRCGTVEHTALQLAQRRSGGLCFRLLCVSPTHRPADGVLVRHNLHSGISAYPHVYHCAANQGSENIVHIFGQPAKLEAYAASQKFTLQVQPNIGLCYKFRSLDDSETFQQLVHGARLVKRFDVKSITSSAHSGHPTRHVAVRIWESISSGSLSIMFRALLVDKVEAFPYYESASAFISPPSTPGDKVRLKLTSSAKSIPLNHRRTSSTSSNVSDINTINSEASLAGGPSLNILAKIKWVEIEFEDRNGRDEFLKAWKGESSRTG